MGIITLALLISLEAFFLVWSIAKQNGHKEEKGIIRIALLAIFCLLLFTGVFEFSFRYILLLFVMAVQAVAGVVILVRKREKTYSLKKNILRFVGNSLLFIFVLAIAILFPQYQQPQTTGDFEIANAKYTWSDSTRIDEFSQNIENRALTVEFWFPENSDTTFPLVVFSHGAFGFSGSNYSTFAELASNGYVVASIGHTHQAFYTMDENRKVTIADAGFIKKASEINAINSPNYEEDIYNTTREWMQLRTDDENFVLDTIINKCINEKDDSLFSLIDIEQIGLIGHSLGGASSAQLGRTRSDIDAVIVLDGTMLGEEVAFENGALKLNNDPYPVPLLNIYAEDHYTNSLEQVGDNYSNFNATQNAICAYETVFMDAGHLNFTDLPLFSPTLAKMLGVGTIDEKYCIETMNKVVLEFFDSYLKNTGAPVIEKEY
jgi:predicted dienelactone hydrolase